MSEQRLLLSECSVLETQSVNASRRNRSDPLNSRVTLQDDKGNVIPTEVAVMLKLAAESDGTSSHVSLLDWYQLVGELVLVMERPMPAENYNNYLPYNKFCVKNEEDVKVRRCDQLRGTAMKACRRIFL